MRGIALGLALLALSGCDRLGGGGGSSNSAARADFNPRYLEQRVGQLENEMLDLRLQVGSVAHLRPQSHNFTPIASSIGVVTVSIQDVSPFADGSRVRLQFGNPTYADINRFEFTVSYGPGEYRGAGDKTDTLQFTQHLRAGTWTNVNADLAGVSPSQLGHVTILSFQASNISLITR
jgi:hypothetical protein